MKKLPLTVLGLLLLAALGRADKLRLDRIPAGANWLIHVDVDGFKQTELWKVIEEHAAILDLEEVWEGLDEVEQEFGINPMRDIRSVTVFGNDSEGEDGVVMINVRGGVAEALERMREEPEFRVARRSEIDIYQWMDGSDSVSAYVHPVRGSDDALVLIGEKETDLVSAAQVLRRDAESMESSEAPRIHDDSARNALVYVAAVEGIPGLDGIENASVVTELAQSVYMSFCESRGMMQVRVSVTARNNEDAKSMADIFQGAAALARLGARGALGADPGSSVFDILRALAVQTRGNTVTLDWEYDVRQLFDDLWELGESF